MEQLEKKKVCGFYPLTEEEKKEVFEFSKPYIEFLNKAKTEREVNKEIIKELVENGFVEVNQLEELHSGDKVYYNNRGKGVYAAIIGEKNLTEGMQIVGSHIDSPRLDLKPNPLYEDANLALLKTHY